MHNLHPPWPLLVLTPSPVTGPTQPQQLKTGVLAKSLPVRWQICTISLYDLGERTLRCRDNVVSETTAQSTYLKITGRRAAAGQFVPPSRSLSLGSPHAEGHTSETLDPASSGRGGLPAMWSPLSVRLRGQA